VAGQQPGTSAPPGRLSRAQRENLLSEALRGTGASPDALQELLNRHVRDGGAGGLQLFGGRNRTGGDPAQASEGHGGAAAAAGVLTAVDEDDEGDEEAPVPNEFDYYTDNYEEDEQ
jgi:26S proteasome regulatory subunit N2